MTSYLRKISLMLFVVLGISLHVLAQGMVTGKVIDATTGLPVPNARVSVDMVFTAMTDGAGFYTLRGIPPSRILPMFEANPVYGNAPLQVSFENKTTIEPYTLLIQKQGYIEYSTSEVYVLNGITSEVNGVLSPVLAGTAMRFVLTWGTGESDLDSYLITPEIDSTSYLIYYGNHGDAINPPYAILDIDDTDYSGPETITLNRVEPGTYTYYVHNFSNNLPLSQSEGVVTVYSGNSEIARITVPQSGEGTYWIVGALDVNKTGFTPINQITTQAPVVAKIAEKKNQLAESAFTFMWNFGDGNSSAEEHPMNTYTQEGVYDVSLTASMQGFLDPQTLVKEDLIDVRDGQADPIYESTMQGGLWSETSTWLNNVVPAYGSDVIINGPVMLDISTETMNLTVRKTGLIISASPDSNLVDLMVVGDLTNEGKIYTNRIANGFSFNVIGDIDNNGIIAPNIFRLFGDSTQVMKGYTGVIGYYHYYDLPTHLNELNTQFEKPMGRLIVYGRLHFSGVTISSEMMGFDLTQTHLDYSTNEIGFMTDNPSQTNMLFSIHIWGGRLFSDNNSAFFSPTFESMELSGQVFFTGAVNLNGTIRLEANLNAFDIDLAAKSVKKMSSKAEIETRSTSNSLYINGNLFNKMEVKNSSWASTPLIAYLYGNLHNQGRWEVEELHILGETVQEISSVGINTFLTTLVVYSNVANATTYQWVFDDDVIEGENSDIIRGEVEEEGLNGVLSCSTNVGISRPIHFMIEGHSAGLRAEFQVDKNYGPAPLFVQFTDHSSGPISSWYWEFGDGGESTQQNPQYTYLNSGTYTVRLTVADETGHFDTATYTDFIHIYGEQETGVVSGRITSAVTGLPISNAWIELAHFSTRSDSSGYYRFEQIPEAQLNLYFSANPTQGLAPLVVQFNSMIFDGTYPISVFVEGYQNFHFSQLMVVAGQETVFDVSMSPVLINQDMRFVLTWDSAPNDLDAHLFTPMLANGLEYHVFFGERGNQLEQPFAALDYDVTNGYGPETMTISKLQNGIYHYFIYNYSNESPLTTSKAVVQLYNRNGLAGTVTVPEQGEGSYWYVASIDGSTGEISIVNQILTVEPGNRVTKEVLAKKLPQTTNTGFEYQWYFGDGFQSNDPNPSHLYNSPGNYTVALHINDGMRHAEMTIQEMIHVMDAQHGIIARNDTAYVTAGMAIKVNMLANDVFPPNTPLNVWLMDVNPQFGMVFPAMQNNTSMMYISSADAEGVDAIRYALSSPTGYSEATIYIHVLRGVLSNQAPVVYLPLEVSMLEDSVFSFPVAKAVYDDHDALSELLIEVGSRTPQLSITLDAETGMIYMIPEQNWWGTARVGIKATDRAGAWRVDSMIVTVVPVNDLPIADFAFESTEIAEMGMNVKFTDTSHDVFDPEGTIVSWMWDFGDLTTSTLQHPEHLYSQSGAYQVQLTVTDNAGAVSTKTMGMDILVTSTDVTKAVYTLALHGNYPNPFNPTTTIKFEVPNTNHVELSLFNLLGQRVSTLVSNTLTAGVYEIPFDASNLSSGVYMYVLRFEQTQLVRSMTLIK